MSYTDSEESTYSGKPRELYKFEGTYGNYYYTSGQGDVTYLGNTYRAVEMRRTNVKVGTQEDDGLDISIDVPIALPVVRDYAFRIAPPKLQLTVYRFHDPSLAPGTVAIYWNGPVTVITVKGGRAAIRSPSVLSYALSGDVPSIYYQTPCNRVLFDQGCKVNRSLNSVTTTATPVTGRTLALASNGGRADGFFTGGEVLLDSGERRMIVNHVGTTVEINFPFARMSDNSNVVVTAGCNRAYAGDCLNKFNNQQNFGGFPFIPSENPFETGID